MQVIKLDGTLSYDPKKAGAFSFIITDPGIIKEFSDREGVCLKVFFEPMTHKDSIKSYWWGRRFVITDARSQPRLEGSWLLQSLEIQNLLADKGLAPRVYDVKLLWYKGNLFPAVVMDYLEGDLPKTDKELKEILQKCVNVGKELGFTTRWADTSSVTNAIDGKWIDFQGWYYTEDYMKGLEMRYKNGAKWSGNTYQTIPELGFGGYRGEERLDLAYTLIDMIDFEDKIVWDIGCSGGWYITQAARFNAKKAIGIDYKEVIEPAREVANAQGIFNVDFLSENLEKGKDYSFLGTTPDIIFYLNVYRYFGFSPYLKKANIVVYEHNGDVTHEQVIKEFLEHFEGYIDFGKTGKEDNRRTMIFFKKGYELVIPKGVDAKVITK